MPEVTYIGLGPLLAKGRAAVETAVVQSAEDLVARQMEAAPVDAGTLRAGIHLDSIENTGDTITTTNSTGGESADYAIPVHEGAREHVIEAKNAQALFWDGADHPVKKVVHPATAGNPYMSQPLLDNIPVYERAMAAAAAEEF